MGRFKKVTAKTPEDAASEGLSSMAAFFKPVPRPAPAPPVNKGEAPRRRHPPRWSEGGTDGGPVHWPPATDRGADDGRCDRSSWLV